MATLAPYDLVLWLAACLPWALVLAVFVHALLVHVDLLDYRAAGGRAGWWAFRKERQRCKQVYRRSKVLHEQGLGPEPGAPTLGAYVRKLESEFTETRSQTSDR